MSSDVKCYELGDCAGYSIQMVKDGFFGSNISIPMIGGQVIKGVCVGSKNRAESTRLPNVQAIKKFGKSALGLSLSEGGAFEKLDGKVIIISRKHAEVLVARVVAAVSVLFISYLLFRNII